LAFSVDGQEKRLTGASGNTYTYDGDGNRVRKSNIRDIFLKQQKLACYVASGD
jgi:hypothetical protein